MNSQKEAREGERAYVLPLFADRSSIDEADLSEHGGRASGKREAACLFLDSHRDADFICLQEVWSGPYENLEGVAAGAATLSQAEVMVYGKQAICALL